MHPEGKNIPAKLISAGLQESSSGETQPYLKFQTEHGEITWFGSLKSELSQTFSVKQLVRAGFIGDDFSDLEKPLEVAFLPEELTITVEMNEYKGKITPRLTFVNKAKKEYTGQAPKMAALFASVKAELGVKGKIQEPDAF